MKIYIFLNLLVLTIFIATNLCYFIKSRYKFHVTMIISLSCNFFILALTYTLVYFNGYGLVRPYSVLLFICANLLLSRYLSINRDYRAFFSATLVFSFSMAVRSISEILLHFTENYTISTIITIIFYGIVAYFTIMWLAPITTKLMEYLPEIWKKLWLIPMAFVVLHFLLAIKPAGITAVPAIIPALIALVVIQIFIYYFIFSFYYDFMIVLEEKRDIQSRNTLTAMVMGQQDLILEAENKIRIFRHDARHYVSIMATCLETGNIEKAQSILSQRGEQIDSQTEIIRYCSNFPVNAVISNYKKCAKKNNIDFTLSIALPKKLPVDETDFSVVISNALENALHACLKIVEENNKDIIPKIEIICSYKDGKLFLEVKNTYSGTVYFDANGKLPVAIDDDHGIGIRSISSFAEQNNALLDYNANHGIFTLHMLLYV